MSVPTVRVWEKVTSGWRLAPSGLLGDWESLTVRPVHNGVGTWSLSTRLTAQTLALLDRRRLVTVDLPDVDGLPRTGTRFTGRIRMVSLSHDGHRPVLEVSGTDALSYLAGVICFPDPDNGAPNQTTTHWTGEGQAESVVLDLIRDNLVARRGEDVTVAASQGRGDTVTIDARFPSLLQRATRVLARSGLAVRVGLVGTGSLTSALTVSIHEAADRSRRVILSPDLGTIRSWSQTDVAPSATRVVVMGPGKGLNRRFRVVSDADATAAWGWLEEATHDARGVQATEDLKVGEQLVQAGEEALADATGGTAFELDATEAEGMRYGVHFWLGDRVTVRLAAGVESVEPLAAVEVSSTRDRPMSVSLIPGEAFDVGDPAVRQARTTQDLARRIRNLEQEEGE